MRSRPLIRVSSSSSSHAVIGGGDEGLQWYWPTMEEVFEQLNSLEVLRLQFNEMQSNRLLDKQWDRKV